MKIVLKAFGAAVLYVLTITLASAQSNQVRLPNGMPHCGGPEQKLEDTPAVWATVEGNTPLVIFVHGGAWRRGDKQQAAGLSSIFNAKGYTLASLNYRLDPKVGVSDQVQDVCAGIQYLLDNAKKIGFDPKKIVLIGHSAGANLAALATPSLPIRALILLDGVGLDVARDVPTTPALRRVFGNDPTVWPDASPISAAQAGVHFPPTYIAYTDFRPDTAEQAKSMYAALLADKMDVVMKFYPGRKHGSFFMNLRQPQDEMSQDVFAFLAKIKR